MDSKIDNQFVKATTSVFLQISNASLAKIGQEYFPDGNKFSAKIATILGISGAFKGQFILLIDEPMALKIASASVPGGELNNTGEQVDSAVREFCNMVGGMACKRLYEMGHDCDITFPSVARGKDIETASPSFFCKFESEWGQMQQILKFDFRAQIK